MFQGGVVWLRKGQKQVFFTGNWKSIGMSEEDVKRMEKKAFLLDMYYY